MSRTKRVSRKQRAANRRNAARSTGPRTPAGRQSVSLNAVKHGLAASVAILPVEDREAYEAFCRGIIAELAPAGPAELRLARTIATDFWRLDRIPAIENNMYAVGLLEAGDSPEDSDPLLHAALASARTFLDHAPKFCLLAIYEQRLHRAIHRNRLELRRLQAARPLSARQAEPELPAFQ